VVEYQSGAVRAVRAVRSGQPVPVAPTWRSSLMPV